MKASVRHTGQTLGQASDQLLGNNIEVYEHTIPSMLSDRLRNPKFSGPANPQSGVAAEWEPIGNTMSGLICQLVPGHYLSGQESQMLLNFSQRGRAGICQTDVTTHAGEVYDIELWARAQDRPVTVTVSLHLRGHAAPPESTAEMTVDMAHWQRVGCQISAPGDGPAFFKITIPGDSRVHLDQIHLRPVGESHVSQALQDVFHELPCASLRFPGGCASCSYHWEHGIGPVHLRPVCDDPVFKYKMHYDFGTDEYLELCAAHGIRPFITLNSTTATPEQAAAWAAYLRDWYIRRDLPVPTAYLMIGNENYGIHELGHMTGEMYVNQLRAFVPGLRASYPEARILAIGEYTSRGLRDDYTTPWRDPVIQEAADLFDCLAVTRYCRTVDSLPFPESMANVADHVSARIVDLERQVSTVRDAGLDCSIGIVEWNFWTRASHNDHAGFYEPNDVRHCLYAAGLLNAFCRLGERLELANYYSLVNTMGMIHIHDGDLTLSDMARIYQLYRPALPGRVLELEVDAPALTETSAVLDANIISGPDATYAFLVNYSATDTVTVSLSDCGQILAAEGLRADQILTPLESVSPAVNGQTVTVPPATVLRLTLSG